MKKLFFLFAFLSVVISYAQIVNIPDANFKAKLLNAEASATSGVASTQTVNEISSEYWTVNSYSIVDTNNDGEIQVSEAQAIKYLSIANSNITDMTGIESFVNLEYLRCNQNQISSLNISQNLSLKFLDFSYNLITSVNISQNTSLRYLGCSFNPISELNVLSNSELKYLACTYSNMTNINVTQNPNLEILYCGYNILNGLDVSQNQLLKKLNCSDSQLTELNISQNLLLKELNCSYNQLTNLNLSQHFLLEKLYCNYNLLTSLDIFENPLLQYLDCSMNLLTYLGLKNGNPFTQSLLDFSNNYSLEYICADEVEINFVQQKIINYALSNICVVNSYCSFTPGGTFYTIQGNSKFDSNNNGCDATDLIIPNQKFTITNGSISGTIIANNSGNYQIPVQSGTHTITPDIENPNYFSFSPLSATITFPTEASPFTQNFCVIPNGVHNDLEVTILPIGIARPGFDATYKIVYKNKGNQISSGTVSLSYNDALMDLVNTNPINSSSATNILSWDYTNLNPFEIREIIVVFNINAPTGAPAVNNGDVLTFTSNISIDSDETPNDNSFTLAQTVVNSFDPNDKTCLEGATIAPDMVGEFVHYIIRFENTGTAPAENIVVADIIDTTKFELASLVPLRCSHDFFTRMNNTTGKVEFIFENINLPFDDANNDGYVSFKIKTKPTLVVGNTFNNTANIYFDYNFPIITNTATTTVTLLGKPDVDFGHYFSMYPNPTKDVLAISNLQDITISSLSIYNSLGQLMQLVTSPKETIDVSNLKTGSYYIKLITEKGIALQKFIKE